MSTDKPRVNAVETLRGITERWARNRDGGRPSVTLGLLRLLMVRLDADAARISELEDQLSAAKTEANQGVLSSGAISAIREMLTTNNVPAAAFIDDHVGNAIVQRNEAKAKLAKAVEALRLHVAYEATPSDRGGKNGTKGKAYQAFIDARDLAIYDQVPTTT